MAQEAGHAPGRSYTGQDGRIRLNGTPLEVLASDLVDPDTNVPTLPALPTGAPAGSANAKWILVEDSAGNGFYTLAWPSA